jgi:hypothetical protein
VYYHLLEQTAVQQAQLDLLVLQESPAQLVLQAPQGLLGQLAPQDQRAQLDFREQLVLLGHRVLPVLEQPAALAAQELLVLLAQ